MACGGSRLSSIGDIEVPRIVEPKNLVNLIKDDSDNSTISEDIIIEDDGAVLRWKCKICTLENAAFNYYCDACNSPKPRKDGGKQGGGAKEVDDKMKNEDMRIMVNRIVRYVGIGCFCLILVCALFNMLLSIIGCLRTFLPVPVSDPEKFNRVNDETPAVTNIREAISVQHINTDNTNESADNTVDNVSENREDSIEKAANDVEQDPDTAIVVDEMNSDSLLKSKIFFDIFGLLPIVFVIYGPLFLYLATKMCKMSQIVKITPRVAQPM